MKIIDSNFKDIENDSSLFNDIASKIIEYLKTKINDEELFNHIVSNADHSLVQLTDGKTYTILAHDKSFKSYKFRDSAGAFKTNMAVSVSDKEINIIPGVALRPNYTIHQLIHELLHAISSNQHNYFNEEGIAFTKTGIKIDFFDKNLEDVSIPNNPSSNGLNEGITEALASIIDNQYTGNYPGYLTVASLLLAPNDLLLNSYFSKEIAPLEAFYNDLEEKQSIISRDDLINLESKSLNDSDLARIIAGTIKYNEAYNNQVDLSSTANYLDKFYMLDSGSWSELLSAEINKHNENVSSVNR